MSSSLSPDKLRQLHIALEQTGSVSGAARLLKAERGAVAGWVDSHPELRSYLKDVDSLDAADMISRPALPPPAPRPITPPAAPPGKILKAVESEEAKLKKGFQSIGLTGAAVDEAVAFTDFGGNHFEKIRSFMAGGITKTFSDLLQEVKDLRARLNRGGMPVEEEQMVRESLATLLKLALECYSHAMDAVKVAALVKAAQEKKKKPGFTGVVIQSSGPLTVSDKPQGS